VVAVALMPTPSAHNRGFSGTVTRNNQISTIDIFGPEYRVVIDINVRSACTRWSNIIHFTSSGADCCDIGDRVLAIFYQPLTKSNGILRIGSAVGFRTHYVDYNIDLEKWYHIEIIQIQKKNGKFYYTLNINGDEIVNVENRNPQSFEDVKVFAGLEGVRPSDPVSLSNARYKNFGWITPL